MDDKQIKVTCSGADSLPIDSILEFQGSLKKLTNTNRDKLMKSILEEGFTAPIFIWNDSGENKILDGHQRLKTLLYMRKKGYTMPFLPVVYIDADDEKHAKRKLLKITSQYGEFDVDELNEWVNEAGADILESCRFANDELLLNACSEDDFDEEFSLPDGDKEPFQQMTFTLADAQAEYIKERITEAKKELDFDLIDCFGNENGNGNALYCLIKGFVNEQS